MHIAFTGPRRLTDTEIELIYAQLDKLDAADTWHVGDAKGADALVRDWAQNWNIALTIHEVETKAIWAFAKRSKQMVDAATGGKLIAFPNKPCPPDCTPKAAFSGHGSGTWGTIAYAKHKGLEIELHPLAAIERPEWMEQKQLSLL
jgi:YspA, cpYpsA-related SLOG family